MTVRSYGSTSQPGYGELHQADERNEALLVARLSDTSGRDAERIALSCAVPAGEIEAVMGEAGWIRCEACRFWLDWSEFVDGAGDYAHCSDCRTRKEGP